jgi:hypothetical protein
MFDIVAGYKLVGSHSGVKLCRWTKVIFDALTMLSCIYILKDIGNKK